MLGLGRLCWVGRSGSTQWNNPTNLTDPTGFMADGDANKEPEPQSIVVKKTLAPCEQISRCIGTLTTGSGGLIFTPKESSPSKGKDNSGGQGANASATKSGTIAKEAGSVTLDIVPVVGTVKSVIQVVTGKDLITGEEVNRAVEAGGIFLGMIPGGKLLTKGGKMADVLGDVVKHEKKVEALGKDAAQSAISTGRTTPNSLKEKLAMDEVMAKPAGTTPPRMPKMSDTKNGLLAEDGWVKRSQNVNGVEIHYVENINTKQVVDFKFKD